MTREEKMNKRREQGKTYQYQPNPYPKGSKEYERERRARAEKVKNSGNKSHYAKMRSLDAKLDNYLREQEKRRKVERESKKSMDDEAAE